MELKASLSPLRETSFLLDKMYAFSVDFYCRKGYDK